MSTAPTTWEAERASLRKQITDLERIKHDLEGRLFDALKTDRWLREGLREVDHAPTISRGVYSKVLDVAAVHVAHTKLLVEALEEIEDCNVLCPEGGHETVAEIHCIARAVLAKVSGSQP